MPLPRICLPILALAAFASGCPVAADPDDNPPEKTVVKPAEIDRLIKQLGSNDFEEREAAQKALEKIGPRALEALRAAASKSTDQEIRGRAAKLVASIEQGIDSLLVIYRDYDLPLPPKGAVLVKYWRTDQPPEVAFLVKKGREENPPLLLKRDKEFEIHPEHTITPLSPKDVSGKDLAKMIRSTSIFSDTMLYFALQCKHAGYTDWAENLLAASLQDDPEADQDDPKAASPKSAVHALAWRYWNFKIDEPKSDWTKAAKQLRRLIEADSSLDTESHRYLLKSLEAAVKRSKAKPGSIDALVDELIDLRFPLFSDPFSSDGYSYRENARYMTLAERSFEAVPALIEHLDDDRLTRCWMHGFNNFPSYQMRVRHLASSLLHDISGEDLGADEFDLLRGYCVAKADSQDWWESVKDASEETYLTNRVFPPKTRDEKRGHLKRMMVWIIGKRYPQSLPKIYRRLLDDRPELYSHPIVDAIRTSSLSRDEKTDLLLLGAAQKNLDHRWAALRALKEFDQKNFDRILTETLENLPKTPSEPYWTCPEAKFARLARETDDPGVWKALEKAAKNADVGLRMEMLGEMYILEENRCTAKQRLKLLAAFLDDTTLRDGTSDKIMFEGPYAEFYFPKLEVRDFAALQIARELKLKIDLPKHRHTPDPKPWSPEQWEHVRKQVREAVKKHFDSEDDKVNPEGTPPPNAP
jgi:hypothetical protein